MMSSTEMALKGVMWLKTKKSCYLHCTEYGYLWRADVIGTNGTHMFEIEIKTSWTDFKADFDNNGYTDLLILSNQIFVLMNFGNNDYKFSAFMEKSNKV